MTFNNYDRATIAALCERYGPLLKLPPQALSTGLDGSNGLDPRLVLWALSGNESYFGANCRPRHEPAYFSGRYSTMPAQAELNAKYGEYGAASYGPWQIMLLNAPGFTPEELAQDAEKAVTATVGFMNRRVFTQIGAHVAAYTLAEIGHDFNHGNYWDGYLGADVEAYVANLKKHYDTPMVIAATGGVIHP